MYHVIKQIVYRTVTPTFIVEKTFDSLADASECASILNRDIQKEENATYVVAKVISTPVVEQ